MHVGLVVLFILVREFAHTQGRVHTLPAHRRTWRIMQALYRRCTRASNGCPSPPNAIKLDLLILSNRLHLLMLLTQFLCIFHLLALSCLADASDDGGSS